MEYYFETDDRLDRKRYAEFLKSMLENCDKYRREDSDGAYVIAIDSPWGTGKTRFAKMLRNYLEDRTKEMGDDSLPGKNAAFNAIYYNSWETDFSDDALLPLIHTIVNSPEFKAERFSEKNKEALNKFKEAAKSVAKVATFAVLHAIAGETATEMVKAAGDALSAQEADPLESYKQRLQLLEGFRKSLEEVIKHTKQKKLVIIVDELDRCRPTFAIQTLELAKHLFAVKGLVFIFALDIKQLSSSVKTVYGQELDAPGYLCRFFDYIGRVPTPDIKQLISLQLGKIDYYISKPKHFLEHNAEFIKRLVTIFGFSLRDVDTLIKSYSAMCKCFLEKYDDYSKHQVYLFLLSLKYKDIETYNRVFRITPALPKIETPTSDKFVLNSHKDLSDYLKTLENEDVLRNAFFTLTYRKESKKEFTHARIHTIDASLLRGFGTLIIHFYVEPGGITYQIMSNECDDFSLGQVLFYEDLVKWEEIKEMTISAYLYSQLEMFNFALPADNPETQS